MELKVASIDQPQRMVQKQKKNVFCFFLHNVLKRIRLFVKKNY